jgi:hypothetical protein
MLQATAPSSAKTPSQTATHPADRALAYVGQPERPPPRQLADGGWATWGPALVALGGVLITLTAKWAQDRRSAKQDLRRELFLKVTDALTESSGLLGSFGKTTTSIDQLGEGFLRCLRPLNQAEIVAEMPLVTALTSFKNQLGLGFGTLIRARLPMEPRLMDIAANKPLIEDASVAIAAILAEQNRLLVDGIRTAEDQARFDRLRQRFAYFQGTRQTYFDADAVSHNAIKVVVADVGRIAVTVQRGLINARVLVLSLMRKELGFKFDVDAYTQEHIAMAELAIADFGKTSDEVDRVFQAGDSES